MSKKEIDAEEKQTLKGFAEFCLKCGKGFKEDDNLLGALYCNLLDRPGDWERKNVINIYKCTEYVCTASRRKIKEALCYECFNKYIENGTIAYDGYDNIYTPEDFFRVTYLAEKQQEMEVENNPQLRDLVKRYWDWATDDLLQATTIDSKHYPPESIKLVIMGLERRNYLQSVREIFLTEHKKPDEEILLDEENLENSVKAEMYQRPAKDIGFGLLALIGAVVGILFGFAATVTWYRILMTVLFGIGFLNCLIMGKYLSGIGWLLHGIGFIVGFYVYGRWGMLIGLGIAFTIITPIVNKYEEKII